MWRLLWEQFYLFHCLETIGLRLTALYCHDVGTRERIGKFLAAMRGVIPDNLWEPTTFIPHVLLGPNAKILWVSAPWVVISTEASACMPCILRAGPDVTKLVGLVC